MAKDKKSIQWLGRHSVLDEQDIPSLEASAAVHEFKHRLPREAAENRAHADYVSDKALDAAAHHLVGVRVAHSAGHTNAARQHGAAYAAAMAAAGHDPTGVPPKEILDKIASLKDGVYNFKSHKADGLWPTAKVPEADSGDNNTKKLLDSIRELREKLR